LLARAKRLERTLEGRAIVQVVRRLQRRIAGKTVRCADGQRLRKPFCRKVRRPDRLDLALPDQLRVRLEGLRDRCAGVVVVGLVEIDRIDMEAP